MDWAHSRRAATAAMFVFIVSALLLNFASGAQAAGFSMFDTPGVGDKPQSKLWYRGGSWWGCLNNSSKLSIYKLNGATWTKKYDVASPVLPVDKGGTCDVLWDGTHLFILTWHPTSPKLYKLSYNSTTDNYAMMAGFPVNLGIQAGSETIVMDKDSTGRLWLTYEGAKQIWVQYTTTADHRIWSTPLSIGTNVIDDDISTIVAFGGNKIGVIWSDQTLWRTVMRVHRDTDAPNVWQAVEVIRSGWGTTDDHLNAKADASGRVFLVVKDYFDTIWVARREVAGTWTVGSGANGIDCGTRPILQLDPNDNRVYLYYTRWLQCANIGTNNIELRVASATTLNFSLPIVAISASSQSMNDVAGSKQAFPPSSGLVICQGGSKAYWAGWGPVSGIGGTAPAPAYPSPPAAPAEIAGFSVTEAPASRALLCRFDESSGMTASDASGNGRTMSLGTGDQTPHWYAGLTNGGLFFDGDDYIKTAGTPFDYAGRSFTLETWLKLDITSTPGTGVIFCRADTLHSAYKLCLTGDELEFSWSISDTADVSIKADGPFLDGAWHHVAAVWDSARSESRLYVNGSRAATEIMVPPTFAGTWDLTMGALVQGAHIDDEFEGAFDMAAIADSAIYDGSFTPKILYPAASVRYLRVEWHPSSSPAGIAGYRLTRRVNGGTPVSLGGLLTANWYADMSPTDGLLEYAVRAVDGLMQEGASGIGQVEWQSSPPTVPSAPLGLAWVAGTAALEGPAFYEMDEGSGHTLPDGTGLGHTGRLGGLQAGDTAQPTWINAFSDKGLRFDGNDYVEIPDATDLRFQNTSMTIELWIRRAQMGSTQALITKDDGSSTRNYGLSLLSSGALEFSWSRTSGGSVRKVTTSATITNTEWHHIACTYDKTGGVSTIYLDGQPVASEALSGTMYVGDQPVVLGARSSGSLGNFFKGDMDLVRISSGLRYTGAFTPPNLYRGGPRRPTIVLSWGLPASGLVKQYRLYRKLLPSGSDTQIATLLASSPTYTDAFVEQNKVYRYTVRALNSANVQGPASAPLDVAVPSATDAQGDTPPIAHGPPLRIEPNPFNPQALVHFRLDAGGPVKVELFDVRGRKVDTLFQGTLPAGVHTARMVRPDGPATLPSGIYFVRLLADGREHRLKAALIK